MFGKWKVFETADGERRYLFGDLSDFDQETLDGLVLIPSSQYTLQDMLLLFENILEYNDIRSFATIGVEVVVALQKSLSISDEDACAFLKVFIPEFLRKHRLK